MGEPMLKLYEFVDAYQAVLDWIDENGEAISAGGGVLPPEVEAMLDGVTEGMEDKFERTACVQRNLAGMAKAAKEEKDRLAARQKSLERQAESLKSYLELQMKRVGSRRIDRPRAVLRFQVNSRPSISAADPKAIPAPFRRVVVELDGDAAYEWAKAEGHIPKEAGVARVGGLVIERGEHLRIQ